MGGWLTFLLSGVYVRTEGSWGGFSAARGGGFRGRDVWRSAGVARAGFKLESVLRRGDVLYCKRLALRLMSRPVFWCLESVLSFFGLAVNSKRTYSLLDR